RRPLIGGALAPKHFPEGWEPWAVPDKTVPLVVADLVAEVSQDGAVGLVMQLALLLALHVIGLGNVDRDEPVVVARQDAPALAARRVLPKLKLQAAIARFLFFQHPQPHAPHRAYPAP